MYNIIQSKYRYIFLICILGILISLFINSTKVVEGYWYETPAQREKRKKKEKKEKEEKEEKEKKRKAKEEQEKVLALASQPNTETTTSQPTSQIEIGTTSQQITQPTSQIEIGTTSQIGTGTTSQIGTGTTSQIGTGTISQPTSQTNTETTTSQIGTGTISQPISQTNTETTTSQLTSQIGTGTTSQIGTGTTSQIGTGPTSQIGTGPTSQSDTSNQPGKTPSVDTSETIKLEVNAKLPSLIKGILEKPIAEMSDAQIKTNKLLDTVESNQNELRKRISDANEIMKTVIQNHNKQLTTTHQNFSSNLSQQYDMYKTGLSNDATVATTNIRDLTKNVSDTYEKTVQSANESKGYAELSNRVYNDVFGSLTTKVVQQDNAEFAGKQGFTSMTSSSGYTQNLFDLEKDVVNAINDFNTTYYNYVRCSSINCNVGTRITENDVIAKSNVVNEKAKALEAAYKAAQMQTSDKTTFDNNHAEIMKKAKSVDELRRNLDTRMDTVLKGKNPPSDLTQQYDSTVYTGIMWSVLATSVLFYVFTEM